MRSRPIGSSLLHFEGLLYFGQLRYERLSYINQWHDRNISSLLDPTVRPKYCIAVHIQIAFKHSGANYPGIEGLHQAWHAQSIYHLAHCFTVSG